MKKIIGLLVLLGFQIVEAADAPSAQKGLLEVVAEINAPQIATIAEEVHQSGKAYYESLIEQASKRKWAVQCSFHYTFEDGGFDCKGCSVPLCALIFGKDPVTIKDVYLFAKLSDDNKVRINNCDALAPERGGVPIGGVGVPFGGFRDDLYTTLLAPVELEFGASQKEYSFFFSGLHRFDIGDSNRFYLSVGIIVPFISKRHTLDLNFKNGELFRSGFIPDTTQRETSLKQFFREFSGLTDFINREVLASKGIEFRPEQSKSGLGDVSVFATLEYHVEYDFEGGLNIVFPSAGKGTGCILWEPILGNGGAYQFNPFLQFLWHSSVPYLNPVARAAFEFSTGFTSDTSRVPTLVTNPSRTQVKNVPGLSAPDTFQNFYVDSFSEFDSCVPLLADKKPCVRKKIGTKTLLGIGNYAYNIFNVDLRWGLFYDYYHKARDSFKATVKKDDCDCKPETIDCKTMEKCSDQTSHAISTSFTYKFSNLFELAAGGTFTFLGKNVMRNRSFYFSVVAVF